MLVKAINFISIHKFFDVYLRDKSFLWLICKKIELVYCGDVNANNDRNKAWAKVQTVLVHYFLFRRIQAFVQYAIAISIYFAVLFASKHIMSDFLSVPGPALLFKGRQVIQIYLRIAEAQMDRYRLNSNFDIY